MTSSVPPSKPTLPTDPGPALLPACSTEYWFRCMDLDGDGALSMFELEFFYEEQAQRLEARAVEPLPFCDLACQVLDLVKPLQPGEPSP